MDPATAVVIAASIAAVAQIVGILLNLKDRGKVKATYTAVTQNGGTNERPTILDKLHEIKYELQTLKETQIAQDVKIDVLWQNQVGNNEDKSL